MVIPHVLPAVTISLSPKTIKEYARNGTRGIIVHRGKLLLIKLITLVLLAGCSRATIGSLKVD